MRTHPTRAAEKQEGSTLHAQRQPLAAQGARDRSGLATTLLALQSTHGNRFVQRFLAAATHGDVEAPPEVEEAIQRTRGAGHPLQPGLLDRMESAFGTDFSRVRLHTDPTADALSRSLSAVAFTTGRDVYFRQGEYDPEGAQGRRLLAHELTHVVQQSGAAGQSKLLVGAPGDAYEQEADHVSAAVVHSLEHDIPRAGSTAGSAHTDSIQRMCTECAQALRQPAMAIQEEEEPVAGGLRPGAGGGCCAGHSGASPLPEDLMQPGVGGSPAVRVSGSATHEQAHVVQLVGADQLQRYTETTEPPSRLAEIAKDVVFGPLGRTLINIPCLNDLEAPMGSITFDRWIPHACRRSSAAFLHSREWDAFGHCWIGCEGTRRCGESPTAILGTGREITREMGFGGPHDSFRQDVSNQALGRGLAYTPGTCFSLCDTAHSSGALDLSAPQRNCANCATYPGSGEGPCP